MDRWKIHKLGLVNFWFYDYEVFKVNDGKVLFRGHNGSGKSVTTQSFIPLILDGDKRPNRLDPFGTKARKIESYLLTKEGETERTAYIFTEFKKGDLYITLGIGLKAQRNKPMDSWYFILNDGRRIEKDLKLTKNEAGVIRVLTKQELKNKIGESAYFTISQSEYKNKVNEVLFDFQDKEDFNQLLNLLINIRTPKLSKDFKPTSMYEVLHNSLRQLSEEDLRTMSESMENMDELQEQARLLERYKESALRILDDFNKINILYLNKKWNKYSNTKDSIYKLKEEIKNISSNITNTKKIIKDKEVEIYKKQDILEDIKHKLKLYKSSDINKIFDEKFEAEMYLKDLKVSLHNINFKIDINTTNLKKLNNNLNNLENTVYALEKSCNNFVDEIKCIDAIKFEENDYFKEEIINAFNKEEIYDFNRIKNCFNEYEKSALEIKNEFFIFNKEKNDLEKAIENLDDVKLNYSKLEHSLKEAEVYLETIKGEYIEKLTLWTNQCTELNINEKELKNLAKKVITSEGIEDNYYIKEFVDENFYGKNKKLNLLLWNLQNELVDVENNIKEKEEDIKDIIENMELKFERSKEVVKNRAILCKNNIPYIPLYKAIDFKKCITNKEKILIESSLMDMGILDALIIPKKFRESIFNSLEYFQDKYLISKEKHKENLLSNYLTIEPNIDKCFKEEIYNVLTNIELDFKGYYNLGYLKGKGSNSYVLKYIGESSRKLYKEDLINSLKKQLNELLNIKEEQLKKINCIIERIKVLEYERGSIPNLKDLEIIFKEHKDIRYDLEKVSLELKAAKEVYESKERLCDEQNRRLFELNRKMQLSLNKENIEYLVEDITIYRDNLYGLIEKYAEYISTKAYLKTELIHKEDLLYDLDQNNIDRDNYEEKILRQKQKIKTYEYIIKDNNYESIKKDIEEYKKIEFNYPKEIEKLKEQKIRKEAFLSENLEANLKNKIKELENEKDLLNIYLGYLKEELNLKYVFKETISIDKLKEILPNIEESLEEQKNKFIGTFKENSNVLREYNLKTITIFKNANDMKEDSIRERMDIVCKFNNRKLNLYEFIEKINLDLESINMLITEREKEIYEDILINTMSQKINAKIYQSKAWVKKMNELINKIDTSSTLKLKLKWEPIASTNENQLHTDDLVKLIENKDFIDIEQIQLISKHFSSKVKETIRSYEIDGERGDYYSIIKEVLDYRKWYRFKLEFEKEGERKKELTDTEFFKLSGGEKAMCMYIPLFSAIYSRYDTAKKDCPKIVSLDEAFAGVDDNNIQNMFALLEDMNLDYILNSQILYGDYEPVKDLCIYELERPLNSNIVAVIPYHWNGRVRELIL